MRGFLLIGLFTVAGCATHSPVITRPPATSFTLREKHQYTDPKPLTGGAYTPMTGYYTVQNYMTYTLPAGVYTATFEDTGGYYYPAPGKVKVSNGFIPVILSGGVYWRRGVDQPDRIYTRYGYGPGGAIYEMPHLFEQIRDLTP